jgi:chromosome segregation ATPase
LKEYEMLILNNKDYDHNQIEKLEKKNEELLNKLDKVECWLPIAQRVMRKGEELWKDSSSRRIYDLEEELKKLDVDITKPIFTVDEYWDEIESEYSTWEVDRKKIYHLTCKLKEIRNKSFNNAMYFTF